MDQMIWTTPLRFENQPGRKAHNKAVETEERHARRRARMNSTPQQYNPNEGEIASNHKPRRRLLSTGDVFENMRGGPSRAYREYYKNEIMTEKERNRELAEVARQEPPQAPSGRNVREKESTGKDKGKETPSFRRLLRRASIGMKERRQHARRPSQSRSSHSAEEPAESYVSSRPSTSASTWHKLRNAASFTSTSYTIEEKSPDLDRTFDYEYPQTDLEHDTRLGKNRKSQPEEQQLPLPGRGALPPYIPERSGGEAARATAAAQNEVLAQVRRMTLIDHRDSSLDWESGVDMSPLSHVDSHRNSTSTGASGNTGSRFKVERIDFTSLLPYEISAHIFGLLDAGTLARSELVSKRWHTIISTPAIWQTSFFREKSYAYSLGHSILPDSGLGLPKSNTNADWKSLYRARILVEAKWKSGSCKTTYLCGHTDSVYCLQFDEHKIITGSRDRTIRFWDLHTYRCLAIIASPAFEARSHKIDNWATTTPDHSTAPPPDGALGGEGDGRHSDTRVSSIEPEVYRHAMHHAASILCLQYDNEILVTGSSDCTVIVHSMRAPHTPLFRLRQHKQAVLDVAFDAKYIVTASKDNCIGVFSRTTGTLLNMLRGHTAPVNSVQINGSSIVSCSGDFSVKLWSLESGTCIREFEGHTKGLACSQFSADGKYIASAGNDKIIRVWDAHTGACVKSVPAHEGLIRSLYWDNVSGRLISGSYDQDILVWDLQGEASVDEKEKGKEGQGKKIKLDSEWRGWHRSWVLSTKGDWRRMISAGQDRRILVCDFGHGVEGVEKLESCGVDADGRECEGGKVFEGHDDGEDADEDDE